MFDLKLVAKYIFRVNALMSAPLNDSYCLGYDHHNDEMVITYHSMYKPHNQTELFKVLENEILVYVQRHKEFTLKRVDRIKEELKQISKE